MNNGNEHQIKKRKFKYVEQRKKELVYKNNFVYEKKKKSSDMFILFLDMSVLML